MCNRQRGNAPRRRQLILLVVLAFILCAPYSVPIRPASADSSVLRLAGPVDDPSTLDPAFARDNATGALLRQVFRGLVGFDGELNPVPELAESIEQSENGLTYTFKLRDGVTFQDGSAITADDVVFSLTRAVSPDTAEGDLALLGGPSYLSDIDGYAELITGQASSLRGVSRVDDRTVDITLTAPNATFPMKLASVPASILDRTHVESDPMWWVRPNGSGPFSVASWEPGAHLRLTAFDNFTLGEPLVGEIEFRLGTRALQSFNLYQQGEIDIERLDLGSIDRVLDPSSGYLDQLMTTPLFGVGYIAFNANVLPFDDPHVRRAIQLVYPRDKIAEVTFDGHVSAPDGLIPPGMLERSWPADLPLVNIEAAQDALAESRYGSADAVPPIEIHVAGYAGSGVLKSVLEEQLGLRAEIIDHDVASYLNGLSRQEFPAFELYWVADYPEPSSVLRSLFHSGSADNYSNYTSPEVDRLLDGALAEPDEVRRADLYMQAQGRIVADNVVIPLYSDVDYVLVRPGVSGVVLTPLGILRMETISVDSD